MHLKVYPLAASTCALATPCILVGANARKEQISRNQANTRVSARKRVGACWRWFKVCHSSSDAKHRNSFVVVVAYFYFGFFCPPPLWHCRAAELQSHYDAGAEFQPSQPGRLDEQIHRRPPRFRSPAEVGSSAVWFSVQSLTLTHMFTNAAKCTSTKNIWHMKKIF